MPKRKTIFGLIGLLGFLSALFNCQVGAQGWSNLGLYGGRVNALAIDPSNPNKIFAGARLGDGLYLTTDGGANWSPVLTGHEGGPLDGEATFRNTVVRAVKIAPSNPAVVWVAHDYAVSKSTDGGTTWSYIPNPAMQDDCTNCPNDATDLSPGSEQFRYCTALLIDRSDPDVVYVGTGGPEDAMLSGAVYKTIDGGASWTKIGFSGPFTAGGYAVVLDHEFYATVRDIAVHPIDPDILWVLDFNDVLGDYRGFLYLSTDGGETWNWDIGWPAYIAEQGLAVKPDEPNVIFFGAYSGIVRVAYPKDEFGVVDWEASISYTQPIGWSGHNVRALVFDPQQDNVLYVAKGNSGDFKLLKSEDGGVSFAEFSHDQQFIFLAPHPTDSDIILGGELSLGVYQGLWVAGSPGTYVWSARNSGVNAIQVNEIAVDPHKPGHLLAATIAGVYERPDAGQDWRATAALQYNQAFCVEFDPTDADGSTYYAGIESFLVKTTDNGTTWSSSNSLGYPHLVNDIAIDPNNSQTLFITTRYPGKVFKSTDGGKNLFEVIAFGASLDESVLHGSLSLNSDGTFTYTHDNSETSSDTFSYHASDGATNSNAASVTILVTPVATSLAAVNDTYIVARGGTLARTRPPGVLSNDVPTAGADVVLDSGTSHGLLSVYKDGSFSYIHDGGTAAGDSFTYHLNDGITDSNIATVSIQVVSAITPPLAVNDVFTVARGGSLTISPFWWVPSGVLYNDVNSREVDFHSVAVDPSDSTHVLAGGGDFESSRPGNLFESVDGGSSWRNALENVIVNSILFDPQSPSTVYAGTGGEAGAEVPLFKSVDGGASWHEAYKGIPGGPVRYGVWGRSATDLYVLRHTGSIPKGGADDDYLLHYHFSDGMNRWTKAHTGVSLPLYAIWGTPSNEIFAAGQAGTVVHFDGSNWATSQLGGSDLYAVWGTSSSDVFVVGAGGAAYHFNGVAWETAHTTSNEDLFGVWGAAADNVYAVGAYGTILHFDGTWAVMSSPVSERLEAVWGLSASKIFAAGAPRNDGTDRRYTILQWDGTHWSVMSTPTVPAGNSGKLRSLWGSSGSDVFTVGDDGVVLHFDGSVWVPLNSEVNVPLYGVWGSAADNVYAVGSFGTIIRYNGSGWWPVETSGDYVSGYVFGEKTALWNAVTDLAFSPEGHLYAATMRQGIYASANEARSWINLGAPPYNIYSVSAGSVISGDTAGTHTLSGEGLLAGYVKDRTLGTGLGDARVTTDLAAGHTLTESDGSWAMLHPGGTYNVTASKPGYGPQTEVDVPVFDGTWTQVDIELSDPVITVVIDGDLTTAVEGAFNAVGGRVFPDPVPAPDCGTYGWSDGTGGNLMVPYKSGCVDLSIEANEGYHVEDVQLDGSSQGAVQTVRCADIVANHQVEIAFAVNFYTVNFQTAAVPSGDGGTLVGTLVQSVRHGEATAAVTAVPNNGYRFAGWSGDYTDSSATLTISSVTANMTVTANFIKTLSVDFLAGPGGVLSGVVSQTVDYGDSCSPVMAVAQTGYAFETWSGGYTGTVNPLILSNVSEDMTITANFIAELYTVTFVAGAGGSLVGAATQTVAYGMDCSAVTAVPDEGYVFNGWTGGYLSADETITVPNVQSDLTVTANFLRQAEGNVNGDDKIDLADAILALQISSGLSPPVGTSRADVNGDLKIGLEELIFVLQIISGVRN